MDDETLLSKLVSCFPKYDDMLAIRAIDPVAWHFRLGKPGKFGFRWRPRRIRTSPSSLKRLTEKLPARFPRLYEKLVLSYRWAEVDLGAFRLLANPRSPGLAGLEGEILKDPGLAEVLLPAGYIQFGKGPDLNYGPVYFDTRRSPGSRDAPIVQLDHEGILCDWKLRVVGELAPRFRALVLDVIEGARATAGRPAASEASSRL